MGPKKGRKKACPPKKASNPKKTKDHEEELCWNFSCDACDRCYTEQEQLDKHFRVHKKCGLNDCKFEASAGEVSFHKKVQHDTGYIFRIMQLDSPEEIERWRMDRKEHFPKSKNTELSCSVDSSDEQENEEELEPCEDVSDVIENELVIKPELTEESERTTLQIEQETMELTKYKPSNDTFQKDQDNINEVVMTEEPVQGDDDPGLIGNTFQNEEHNIDDVEMTEESERGQLLNEQGEGNNLIDDRPTVPNTFQNEQDDVDDAEMTEKTEHGQQLTEHKEVNSSDFLEDYDATCEMGQKEADIAQLSVESEHDQPQNERQNVDKLELTTKTNHGEGQKEQQTMDKPELTKKTKPAQGQKDQDKPELTKKTKPAQWQKDQDKSELAKKMKPAQGQKEQDKPELTKKMKPAQGQKEQDKSELTKKMKPAQGQKEQDKPELAKKMKPAQGQKEQDKPELTKKMKPAQGQKEQDKSELTKKMKPAQGQKEQDKPELTKKMKPAQGQKEQDKSELTKKMKPAQGQKEQDKPELTKKMKPAQSQKEQDKPELTTKTKYAQGQKEQVKPELTMKTGNGQKEQKNMDKPVLSSSTHVAFQVELQANKQKLTAKTELTPPQNEQIKGFLSYFCDTCNCGFEERLKLSQHFSRHTPCMLQGCKFQGQPVAVKSHVDIVHKTGYALNVWQVNSPEAVEKWKDERKKNFPRSKKIVKDDANDPGGSKRTTLTESLAASTPSLNTVEVTEPVNEADDDWIALTDSIAAVASSVSLLSMVFQQEDEVTEPELTEKALRGDAPCRPEATKNATSRKDRVGKTSTYCDACEKGPFLTQKELNAHLYRHMMCCTGSCELKADANTIKIHKEAVHVNKKSYKIWRLNSPDEISSWRDTRRLNFPMMGKPSTYCDACERGPFLTQKDLNAHLYLHRMCCTGSCELKADSETIKVHKEAVHVNKKSYKIWRLNSPGEIINWRDTRKLNFPMLGKPSTYCDACEEGPFLSAAELNLHSHKHQICSNSSCEFKACGLPFIDHQTTVHESSYSYKIWQQNSVSEIQKWRELRRQNFPKTSKQTTEEDSEEDETNVWNMLTNNLMGLATTLKSDSEQCNIKSYQSEAFGKEVKDIKLTEEHVSPRANLESSANKQDEISWITSCDACETVFSTEEELSADRRSHIVCDIQGCKFRANIVAVRLHIRTIHASVLDMSKVWRLNSTEEIRKWKEERRKHFPKLQNVERQALEDEAIASNKLVIALAAPATNITSKTAAKKPLFKKGFDKKNSKITELLKEGKQDQGRQMIKSVPHLAKQKEEDILCNSPSNKDAKQISKTTELLKGDKQDQERQMIKSMPHVVKQKEEDILSNSSSNKDAKQISKTTELLKGDKQDQERQITKSMADIAKQTKKDSLSDSPANKDDTSRILCCDACDCVFSTNKELLDHRYRHSTCDKPSCNFKALPYAVSDHKITVHSCSVDLSKIWQFNFPENVRKWRAERKFHFPRFGNTKQQSGGDEEVWENVLSIAKSMSSTSIFSNEKMDVTESVVKNELDNQSQTTEVLKEGKLAHESKVEKLEDTKMRQDSHPAIVEPPAFSVQESLQDKTVPFHVTSIPSHNTLVPVQSHHFPATQHTLPDTSRPPLAMVQAPKLLQSNPGTNYRCQATYPPEIIHHSLPASNYPPAIPLYGPSLVCPPSQNTIIGGPNHGLSTTPYSHTVIQPLGTPSMQLVQPACLPTVSYPNAVASQILPASNQDHLKAQPVPEGPPVSVAKKESGWGETLNEWAKERMNEDLRKEILKKVDLFKVAQTTPTRENWLKFRQQSRQVGLLQKKAEQLNNIISDRSEQQQIDERKKQNLMLEKDNSVGPKFTCDACDLEFQLKSELDNHLTGHSHCGLDGCKFAASPLTVKSHRTEVHAAEYAQKIWKTNSPDEVEIWKEERRKNFPVPVFVHKEKGTIIEEGESNKSTTLNTDNSNALPKEAESSYKYYCDACDCGFTDSRKSAGHYKKHVQCGRVGCKFEGQPFAVQHHADMVHITTHVDKVWALNSSASVISWRTERKRNFPRLKSFQGEDKEITNLKPISISKSGTKSFEKKFFCDACDIGFSTKKFCDFHCSKHIVCDVGNCRFAGDAEVFGLHIQWQHVTGYVSKIWHPKSLQALVNYIRERKRNYPLLRRKILAPGSEAVKPISSPIDNVSVSTAHKTSDDVPKRLKLATKESTTRFSSLLGSNRSSSSAAESDIFSEDRPKLQMSIATKQDISKGRLPVPKSDALINTIAAEVRKSKWDKPTSKEQLPGVNSASLINTIKVRRSKWDKPTSLEQLPDVNSDSLIDTIVTEVRRSKWDEEPTYEDQRKLDRSFTHTEEETKAYWQDLCNSLANKIVHEDVKSIKDKHTESKGYSETPFRHQRCSEMLTKKDTSKENSQLQNVGSKHILDNASRRKDDDGKVGSVDKSKDAFKRHSSPTRSSSGEKKSRKYDAGNKQVSSSETKSDKTADASQKTRSNDDYKRKGSPVQDQSCKIARKDFLDLTYRKHNPVHHHVSLRGDISPSSRSRSPLRHRRSPHRESSPLLRHCRQNPSNTARSDKIISPLQSSGMPDLPGLLDMIGGRTMEQDQSSAPRMNMLSRVVALKILKQSGTVHNSKIQELKQRVLTELVKEEFGDNVAEGIMDELEGCFSSGVSRDGLSLAEPSTLNVDHLIGQGFVPSNDINFPTVGQQSPPKKENLLSKFLDSVGGDQKEKIAEQLARNREKHSTEGASSSQLHPDRVEPLVDDLFGFKNRKSDAELTDRSDTRSSQLCPGRVGPQFDDLYGAESHKSRADLSKRSDARSSQLLPGRGGPQFDDLYGAESHKNRADLSKRSDARSSQLRPGRVDPQYGDSYGSESHKSRADPSNRSDARPPQLCPGRVDSQFDDLYGAESHNSRADPSNRSDARSSQIRRGRVGPQFDDDLYGAESPKSWVDPLNTSDASSSQLHPGRVGLQFDDLYGTKRRKSGADFSNTSDARSSQLQPGRVGHQFDDLYGVESHKSRADPSNTSDARSSQLLPGRVGPHFDGLYGVESHKSRANPSNTLEARSSQPGRVEPQFDDLYGVESHKSRADPLNASDARSSQLLPGRVGPHFDDLYGVESHKSRAIPSNTLEARSSQPGRVEPQFDDLYGVESHKSRADPSNTSDARSSQLHPGRSGLQFDDFYGIDSHKSRAGPSNASDTRPSQLHPGRSGLQFDDFYGLDSHKSRAGPSNASDARSSQLHPGRSGPQFDDLYRVESHKSRTDPSNTSDTRSSQLHPGRSGPHFDDLYGADSHTSRADHSSTSDARSSQLHPGRVGHQFDDLHGPKHLKSSADFSNTSDARSSQLYHGRFGSQFDDLVEAESHHSQAYPSDTSQGSEKLRLALELTNILSTTGQSEVSDDELAQLVQKTMKSKTSTSGLQGLKCSETYANTYMQNKPALPPVLSSLSSSSATHCTENAIYGKEKWDLSQEEWAQDSNSGFEQWQHPYKK